MKNNELIKSIEWIQQGQELINAVEENEKDKR